MSTIHLIDASPYIFRAYFSLPATLVSRNGLQVNAAYGYATFLLDLLKKENPTHIVIAFDKSLTTSFRNEIYPAYKAQRELPDKELEMQLDICWKITQALGMNCFIDTRYEADDIIATAIKKLQNDEHRFLIVSSDKDFTQLVNEKVTLWDYARDRYFDVTGVKKHFGVLAEQITDLLALMGDKVDNIPGVAGIGSKSAVVLLEHFKDLEEIYQKIDSVEVLPLRGAVRIKNCLEKNRALAFLSKELATLANDVPIDLDLATTKYLGAHKEKVQDLFDQLGFNKIRKKIERWQSSD